MTERGEARRKYMAEIVDRFWAHSAGHAGRILREHGSRQTRIFIDAMLRTMTENFQKEYPETTREEVEEMLIARAPIKP